ncbi:MAG: DUF378 domain-containing protein [Nanoarchaeota archaeon]
MGFLNPRLPEVTWLDNVCLLILVFAAFNWALYGFTSINLVTHFTANTSVHHIIYIIIAFSGLKALFFWNKCLLCSHT